MIVWLINNYAMFCKRRPLSNTTCELTKYLKRLCMRSLTSKKNTKRLWEDARAEEIVEEVFPNIQVLLRLLMLFPLSAAVVEKLFSKL